jgi:hypothetical protein
MNPVTTLSGTRPGEFLSDDVSIFSGINGQLVVIDRKTEPGAVSLFSANGEKLHTIGQPGAGPGEFVAPMRVFYKGDTLHVYDLRQYRVSRFDRNLTFLDFQGWMVIPFPIAVLDDGTVVVQGESHTPSARGMLFHVVEPDGTVSRSIGPANGTVVPGIDVSLARGSDNTFWAALGNSYVITRWSPQGEPLLEVQRTADWFIPWTTPATGSARYDRPQPTLSAVHEDADGLLWTLVHVAASGWRSQGVDRGAEVAPILAEHNALYDTMVEVIDPVKGTLVASRRLQGRWLGFLEGGMIYAYGEDSQGNSQYDIAGLSLERP